MPDEAAHAGVISARLAAAGFTSSPDALEHPLGFLAATSPKGEVDRTSPTQAGRDWNILTLGLSVKKYPLCYCTHRAIDGALDLLREQKVGADKVKSDHGLHQPAQRHHPAQQPPADGAGGKVQHAVRHGELDRRQPRRAARADRRVRAAQGRAGADPEGHGEPDDRVDPKRTGNAPYDLVVIEMNGVGKLESARVTDERGSPQLPLSREELWAKFEDCFAVGNPKPAGPANLRSTDVDRAPAGRQRVRRIAASRLS